MKLPNKIGPIHDSGNELKGIIYTLKTKYKIYDPISSNVVVPQSYGQELGNIGTLVLWNESRWRTGQYSDAWVQLTFPNRKIIPTAYSLKSCPGGCSYATSWIVYGFNSYESYYNESYWDILSENIDSDNSVFCANKINGGMCDDTSVATFQMNKVNKNSKKGYDTIRWKRLASSDPTNPRFTTAALEIYGTLITINKCTKNYIEFRFNFQYILIAILIQS